MRIYCLQTSHIDARLGDNEQRSEPYKKYGERAVQLATTSGAMSFCGVSGFAAEQAKTVWSMQ